MPTRSAALRAAQAAWPSLNRSLIQRGTELPEHLPDTFRLITRSAKSAKCTAFGWLQGTTYLAPHSSVAKRTLCAGSTKGCRATCLAENSGHMPMRAPSMARASRTLLLLARPDLFHDLLHAEIGALARSAHRQGLKPAYRYNGGSDLEPPESTLAHCSLAGVTAYDYTKVLKRLHVQRIAPYHLTYSYSGSVASRAAAFGYLEHGGTVSVVFADDLPDEWEGWPVVDGDAHDLTFLHPPGSVIGLRLKHGTMSKSAAVEAGGNFITS